MTQVAVFSGALADPASGAVVADSGALLSGGLFEVDVDFFCAAGATGSTTFGVEHRNAANDTTLASVLFPVVVGATTSRKASFQLGIGERIRVVATGDITGSVQASLSLNRIAGRPIITQAS